MVKIIIQFSLFLFKIQYFQTLYDYFILLTILTQSPSSAQKPILVSEPPSDPLEPVDKWLWSTVGENGFLYHYPLQFGEPAKQSKTKPPAARPGGDGTELQSVETWLQEQVLSGNATTDLGVLILSITEAVKTITAITSYPVTRNIAVNKGIYETAAPTAFKDEILAAPGSAGLLFSSTDKAPIIIDSGKSVSVSIVPLLCSENIELGLAHGSSFLVSEMLWTGLEPLVGGYVLYGSATILILAMGSQVVEFTLDQGFIFRLTSDQVTVPQDGHHVSLHEGFQSSWTSPQISQILKEKSSVPGYTNTCDCIISDIHRIIKKGGIFLSPNSKQFPTGQFSIIYHLTPLAFVLEKSGGLASNGSVPILDLKPRNHSNTSQVFMGSKGEVKRVEEYLARKENKETSTLSLLSLPVTQTEKP